ncbi:MAG: ATP-binding protein [Eubacterium sp.]|nr:ATP-binding protein [Eubacterium sp.]MCM1214901.1 ATP-binding protein [Lachnospiraceae bacterium]MCM1303528.1 ATP-binding protein [Butyrivibrio sp.]MCM1342708.1 ATP-binding protein [Muribaculaceae bacterium]MCM1238977.1 ATP-binding protein [Lachnospiraceae bacterium]
MKTLYGTGNPAKQASMKRQKDFFQNFDEKTIPLMELILEGMPGGFFIYHADGKEELIYANKAILRIFGCDTEAEFRELTGYTFRGMVYSGDLDSVEESIATQIANSVYDLDYVEYRIIQKDGSVRWIEDYGHFLHTEAYGDIFLVFIEDATDRMKQRMHRLERVNEELRSVNVRESQYKKAILYDAITFFEVDLSKDRFIGDALQLSEGKAYDLFEYMNPKPYAKYTDYIESCVRNVAPESLEEYREFFDIRRLIRCYETGGLEQTFEGWIMDAMGQKRLCFYILLLGKNEYTGDIVTLFVVKDITDQIEKQNLLQSALQRAETANLARSVFLSNMSHDIRTPLNAIIGYTELIRNHVMEPDRIDEYNKKIRISGEQLLAIVNESLEITRMESGKVNLVESECHLADLLAEVEKAVMVEINAKSLHFLLDRSGINRFAVVADHRRIKEILCQLLDNAVKYTDPGGNVSLTAEEVENDFPGYGTYRFIVEDNGIGISKEFIGSLFDPFKRESNTTQSGVPGTGLGLTVVKNMVDMMKGDIEVESEPGKGSRFTVSLRLRLQEGQESNGATVSDSVVDQDFLKGKRVLLVEDNEINMEIAEELLTRQGFLVETAEDGSIGLEKVAHSEPGYYDLILMDIQMPVMDGHEAARKIRQLENRQLAQIPIIALSANAFAEDYQRSMDAGMNAHFPKPIDIHELRELIQTVLGRNSIS